jgi:tetratricopeptide (TPR) repeat protein
MKLMLSRKIVVCGVLIVLAIGVLPAFAQEQTPAPGDQQAQGDMISIVIGYDVLQRAGDEYNGQQYEKAIQDYSLFILLNPTFSQAYHFRGMAYLRLNDLDHALADLNQALAYPQASEQETGLIYVDRARIYVLQDDLESAKKDLDASIAAAPDLPDAYSRRAQFYLFSQDYENALKDFDKLIELAPDFSPGYAGRAFVHANLGNTEEALADYDHVIELEPNNAAAYASRGALNSGQSKFDAALTDFNSAIRLNPNEAGYYLQRGFINGALDKPADAAADYLEWIRRQETRSIDGDPLQPGESQVLPMSQGLSYNLPFQASADQKVTLTASTRADSKTDPVIVLLDTAGKPIAGDDDSGGNFDAAIEDFVVPADGIYTLIVSHAGGTPDGPVRVLLLFGD